MIVWHMLLPLWLMVLPFTKIDVVCVADVVAKVADGIAYQGGCGLWSDVITIGGRWPQGHFVYFSFSSGQLHRTTSIFLRPEEAMLGTGESLSYL